MAAVRTYEVEAMMENHGKVIPVPKHSGGKAPRILYLHIMTATVSLRNKNWN
jgi:hypothetical protein